MNAASNMKVAQDNQQPAFTKKNCIHLCRKLRPESAYEVLARFHGEGFARWFVETMER